jgi:hypothetical protein
MKMDIRDKLREIACPETTAMTSPAVPEKSKGAKKTIADSTTREPSLWEHVDKQFPDSQASQSKPSSYSKKVLVLGNGFLMKLLSIVFFILARCPPSCAHILKILLT